MVEINVGTEDDPKNINLSKSLLKEQKSSYVSLFKQYLDVFTWKYEDLKTYDT